MWKRKGNLMFGLRVRIHKTNIMEKEVKITELDKFTLSLPEGWEIDKDKSKIFIREIKQKTLNQWWREYKDTPFTALHFLQCLKSGSLYVHLEIKEIIDQPWYILVDFYRWLADQLNENDSLNEWETIVYGYEGNGFVVETWSDAQYSFIRHKTDTAHQIITILGEGLLRKIFQVT